MRTLYLFLILALSQGVFAQTMLVVERPGTVKNQIYQAGDFISLKTKEGLKISGPINIIKDSTLIVDFVNELKISEIDLVYKARAIPNIFGNAFIGGGIMYLGLDWVNGGLKNKNLIEDTGFLSSMGFITTGIILKVFSKKKMEIDGKKWRIKVLKS